MEERKFRWTNLFTNYFNGINSTNISKFQEFIKRKIINGFPVPV